MFENNLRGSVSLNCKKNATTPSRDTIDSFLFTAYSATAQFCLIETNREHISGRTSYKKAVSLKKLLTIGILPQARSVHFEHFLLAKSTLLAHLLTNKP